MRVKPSINTSRVGHLARGALPKTPPLWASVREAFVSTRGCTAASWAGLKGLHTVPAQGTPTVAADPGYFRGLPVGQATATGSSAWKNTTPGAQVVAAGEAPYALRLARLRSVPSSDGFYAFGGVGIHNSTQCFYTFYRKLASSSNAEFQASKNSTGTVRAVGVSDTNTHLFETWGDGVNNNLRVDRALFQTANATAVTTNGTTIAIGVSPSSNTHYAETSHALYIVAGDRPTVAKYQQLLRWIKARFGRWGVAPL